MQSYRNNRQKNLIRMIDLAVCTSFSRMTVGKIAFVTMRTYISSYDVFYRLAGNILVDRGIIRIHTSRNYGNKKIVTSEF